MGWGGGGVYGSTQTSVTKVQCLMLLALQGLGGSRFQKKLHNTGMALQAQKHGLQRRRDLMYLVNEIRMFGWICGVRWKDKVKNEYIGAAGLANIGKVTE